MKLPSNIDTAIKPILIKLNDLGYYTHWSCAGYDYLGHKAIDVDKDHIFMFSPYVNFSCSEKKAHNLSLFLTKTKSIKNIWFLKLESESKSKSYSLVPRNVLHPQEEAETIKKHWSLLLVALKKFTKIYEKGHLDYRLYF